jgi:hypothetical protein
VVRWFVKSLVQFVFARLTMALRFRVDRQYGWLQYKPCAARRFGSLRRVECIGDNIGNRCGILLLWGIPGLGKNTLLGHDCVRSHWIELTWVSASLILALRHLRRRHSARLRFYLPLEDREDLVL